MWLVEKSFLDEFRAAREKYDGPPPEASSLMADRRSSPVMTVSGDTASVPVRGLLTRSPDLWARFFGYENTTYAEIVAGIAEAEADDRVNTIVLDVDSPGGSIAGLFDAIAAVRDANKPVVAVVETLCASAAYGIASQANTIEAHNHATMIGSVGIVASFFVSDFVVDVTSTEAPNKRPNVKTEEGRAVVREGLDEVHQIFVGAIAEGRNTTSELVNKNFGRGSVFLAEKAREAGMIDAVRKPGAKPPADGEDRTEAKRMDIETLKAEHPDVYRAAVAVGTSAERDRVEAHLTLGEASGAMDTAVKAIRAGDSLTEKYQADYLAAGMNRRDVENAQKDSDAAGAALDSATTKTEDDEVANLVIAKMGEDVLEVM